jgi:hypothetical protein
MIELSLVAWMRSVQPAATCTRSGRAWPPGRERPRAARHRGRRGARTGPGTPWCRRRCVPCGRWCWPREAWAAMRARRRRCSGVIPAAPLRSDCGFYSRSDHVRRLRGRRDRHRRERVRRRCYVQSAFEQWTSPQASRWAYQLHGRPAGRGATMHMDDEPGCRPPFLGGFRGRFKTQ